MKKEIKSPMLLEIIEDLKEYPNGEFLSDEIINSLTDEELEIMSKW
jgi:hypothetical protein